MKYLFEYRIANEENTPARDGFLEDRDYKYNPSDMEKVLEFLVDNAKAEKSKMSIIKDNMPRNPKTIDEMMKDITGYYEDYFASDEIKTSKDELLTRIRFFMNAKIGTRNSGQENYGKAKGSGQTEIGQICIYVKGFSKDCISCPDFFSDTTGAFGPKDAVWFENYLRSVLAHEMFHVCHEYHYKKHNKECIGLEQVKRILMEVFAEYFAVAYMKDYLHKTDPENKNLKLSRVFNMANTRWFGCGRKKLLPGMFSAEEIAADERLWNENKQSEPCLKLNDKNDTESPVGADYAGGYVLSGASELYNAGKNGRQMSEYVSAYEKMLNGKSNEALYELILLKEKYMRDITR